MKIIDLLNKIAKGEEVPKKIKWLGKIYEYDEDEYKFYYQNGYSLYREFFTEGNCLDDEVEIIEENEVNTIKSYELDELDGWRDVALFYQYKFNELIAVIKDMRDKE